MLIRGVFRYGENELEDLLLDVEDAYFHPNRTPN